VDQIRELSDKLLLLEQRFSALLEVAENLRGDLSHAANRILEATECKRVSQEITTIHGRLDVVEEKQRFNAESQEKILRLLEDLRNRLFPEMAT